MIEYSYEWKDGGESRRPHNESVEYVEGRNRYDMEFRVHHGDRHVVSIRGATAHDMLIAFVRGASQRHLKAYRDGLEDELQWRRDNENNT